MQKKHTYMDIMSHTCMVLFNKHVVIKLQIHVRTCIEIYSQERGKKTMRYS